MLFFVIGVPGAFSEWCEMVVTRLAGHASGPTELIRADTLGDLALSAIGSGASQAVVATHRPGGGLCATLAKNNRNFVVALDDPRVALLDLVLDRRVELPDAVQAVASASGAMTRCGSAAGALLLYRERDWQEPEATAAAIGRHLGIGTDPAMIPALIADLPTDRVGFTDEEAAGWWNGLTIDDQELVTGALAPYVAEPENDGAMELSWGTDLFFVGARPDQRAIGPVDITGRAHCLLEGPRIMLPTGAWSLSLTLLFTSGAMERDFLIEVCADHTLASGTLPAQHTNRGEVTLNFICPETIERPISIRISTVRAAFDGSIRVGGARLVRAAPPVPAAADAESALPVE